MKLPLYLLALIVSFTNCASESNKVSTYDNNDPKSLIGEWEIIKEFYENQKIFDYTDNSENNSIRNDKGNFLEIKKDGIVSASVWTVNESSLNEKDHGIYELDNPTGRIRIEISHEQETNLHSGSFRWKLKRNVL